MVVSGRLYRGGWVLAVLDRARPDRYHCRPFRRAPVAQLDRALPSEGRGRRFESCRARQSFQVVTLDYSLYTIGSKRSVSATVWVLMDLQ